MDAPTIVTVMLLAPAAAFVIGTTADAWNVSARKVGGLRFVKIGRLCFSFCITREYRPL